jgi:hypothetical protein
MHVSQTAYPLSDYVVYSCRYGKASDYGLSLKRYGPLPAVKASASRDLMFQLQAPLK